MTYIPSILCMLCVLFYNLLFQQRVMKTVLEDSFGQAAYLPNVDDKNKKKKKINRLGLV